MYELTAAEPLLLGAACRMLDTIDTLDEQVAEVGAMVEGSTGQPVLSPAIAEARLQRTAFGRLVAQLALPDPEGGTVRTPKQVAATATAEARWRAQGRRDA